MSETEALPPHPSHATVRDWMPVSEALRLADLWTVGDLDNNGQWRAAIKVLADEVRAALAQRQQVPERVKYVPVDPRLRNQNWDHPNDDEKCSPECKQALNARGDDEGQGLDGYWKWGFKAGWNAHAALAQRQQVPEGLTELMRHVRRLMAHVDDWQRWYGSADVLLRHQLPLPPAGTVRVMEDLSEAIGRASAALAAAPSAQAEPVTRFCPGCGSVGPVPTQYRDCCPDGSDARVIPEKLAQKCHDLFQLAIRAPSDPDEVAAPPAAQAEPQAPPQRPALVTALRGLLAALNREPTEFELRAAAHEFTLMADRAAAAARAGGDDA